MRSQIHTNKPLAEKLGIGHNVWEANTQTQSINGMGGKHKRCDSLDSAKRVVVSDEEIGPDLVHHLHRRWLAVRVVE